MGLITLLGDSVFANSAHVGPPELITQLRGFLPEGWSAHLSAVDGARVADVETQVRVVPSKSSHLAVSVGGNDAIGLTGLLRAPAPDLGSALAFVDEHRRAFAERYQRMLAAVLALDRPTLVCTIYNPRVEPPQRQRILDTLVAMLNDAIVATAAEKRVAVLDLRPLSADPDNFVSPIELSHRGASSLARSLLATVRDGVCERGFTTIEVARSPEGAVRRAASKG